jgi:hypothetical protein
MGGSVDYLALDDPIARVIQYGDYVSDGYNCGYNTSDSIQEVIDYLKGIHSVSPGMKIGLNYNFPNRRYEGIGPYWGPSWLPFYNITDYKNVTDELFAMVASEGERIDFIHVDSGYDFSMGTASIPYTDFDPRSVDWMKRIVDLERQVKSYHARFGILVNGDGMFQSNYLFKNSSLAYLNAYEAKGGSPDDFILESYGSYPDKLLPDTVSNTFMNTAAGVINWAKGNCSGADTSGDGKVDMTELTTFIGKWTADSHDVTIKEIIEAIGLWKKG